jgi:hypothetical protein
MPAAIPPFKRLLSHYDEDPVTGCWLWNSSTYKSGYGWLKVFGKVVSAHRYSYELHKGEIPKGMHILHSCDVKTCINPEHLRPGTHQENMNEAVERSRIRSGENHPMYGTKNPRPKQAHPVRVLGKNFQSKKEAERELGLGSGTVNYWLARHPEKHNY